MEGENKLSRVEELSKIKYDADMEMGQIAMSVLNLNKEGSAVLSLDSDGYDIPGYGEVFFRKAFIKGEHIQVEFEDKDNGEIYEDTLVFMELNNSTFNDIICDIVEKGVYGDEDYTDE